MPVGTALESTMGVIFVAGGKLTIMVVAGVAAGGAKLAGPTGPTGVTGTTGVTGVAGVGGFRAGTGGAT